MMETLLEENAERSAAEQPPNGQILPALGEDQNGPRKDELVDEAFGQANGWPPQPAPSNLIPPAESFSDGDLANPFWGANGLPVHGSPPVWDPSMSFEG